MSSVVDTMTKLAGSWVGSSHHERVKNRLYLHFESEGNAFSALCRYTGHGETAINEVAFSGEFGLNDGKLELKLDDRSITADFDAFGIYCGYGDKWKQLSRRLVIPIGFHDSDTWLTLHMGDSNSNELVASTLLKQ
jgi:hypothetical protein